jgi:archaellum biogenesis ATPase FlaH
MQRIEEVILSNLIHDESYARQVLPFIKEEYFDDNLERKLFGEIQQFITKHNKCPDRTILHIHADETMQLSKPEYERVSGLIDGLTYTTENKEWLFENTEKFCKDKALYLGIMKSIQIMNGDEKQLSKEAIPGVLQEALGVSFDKRVGHDFTLDVSDRYDAYHAKEDRVPFDMEIFNLITKGGIAKKTLNVVLAATNVGKSLFLCHYAAQAFRKGYNVLYVTLEMAEERIAERIDCNLMNLSMDELYGMQKSEYEMRMGQVLAKTNGRLIIKEYPTSSAHVGHFRMLLDELRTKKNFIPDVLIVDYINICVPQRYKANANINTYVAVKTVTEELRGLAVEYKLPILSATQTNRGGSGSSDVDITDTSESFGLPMTVDLMFALVRTDELDELNQIMVKQLKSRYNNLNFHKRFVIGVNIDKFKLYEVEKPTKNLSQEAPPSGVTFKKSPDTPKSSFNFD